MRQPHPPLRVFDNLLNAEARLAGGQWADLWWSQKSEQASYSILTVNNSHLATSGSFSTLSPPDSSCAYKPSWAATEPRFIFRPI
jgi:hypothetical protein